MSEIDRSPRLEAGGEELPTEQRQGRSTSPDLVDQLWGLFSSVRLALWLILSIAGLSLVGVLVIQAPTDLLPTSPDFPLWLQRVRPRYGIVTDVLAPLQLFTVANSIWMRLLLSLLALNTLVCTLNRWGRIWRSVFHPSVMASEDALKGAGHREALSMGRDVGETASAVRGGLASRGYRVLVQADGATSSVYADRNAFGRLGTLIAHLAIILILVGALVSSIWGFRDSEFVLPEGSTRPVRNGSGLAVKAESFVDEYYPEGPAKDYRSDLVLYDRGVEVKRQTIRVNEPLSYGGLRFHQSFFGPAVVVQVKDESGKVLFEDGVALADSMGGRPMGYFPLSNRRQTAVVIGPAPGPGDPSIKAGQIRLVLFDERGRVSGEGDVLTQGQPLVVDGLTYTFVRERQFTGLQVVSDPGAPIIWVGSALMILGMAGVFYFPHRRCWVRCRLRPGGGTSLLVAGFSSRDPGFGEEFSNLVAALCAQGATPEPSREAEDGPATSVPASSPSATRPRVPRRKGGRNG